MYSEMKVRNNGYYFILHFIYKEISENLMISWTVLNCILDPNYWEFILNGADFSLSESAGNEGWNDPKRLQI